MSENARHRARGETLRAVLLLSVICGVTYFTGLATHGLTNWQEGQRAMVAREMQANGELIVPTVNGEPYLAKPPMVYWCQLGLARVRGVFGSNGEVAVVDLRLTVAIAGWLGVIATFFVGRMLLAGGPGNPDDERHDVSKSASVSASVSASHESLHKASRAAFWSAAVLATGLLYVRSSRIGELDILIVPFAVVAIGAIFVSWRSHLDRGRMHLPATAIATLAASGAMLTKGPPALVCIALGGYGSIVAWSYFSQEAERGINARTIECIRAMSRTHPVAVIGVPFGVLWLWLQAVRSRVGAEVVAAAIDRQASENLNFLVLSSPLKNLEAMSYGVGIGSILMGTAAIWLVIHRRRAGFQLSVGHWVILAWVIGSFIAFSSMGKGIARYLTPMWPGMALMAGIWIVAMLSDARRAKLLVRTLALGVTALAIGQAWWYGFERNVRYADRSPDAFIAALLASPNGVDLARLGAVDIWDPRLDYYAGHMVQTFRDVGPGIGVAGVWIAPIDQLAELVRQGETYTLFIRATPHPSMDADGVREIDRLRMMGLSVQQIHLEPTFRVDSRKTKVLAVRVSMADAPD